MQILLGRYW